jgi:hypothetical protein
MNRIRRFIQNIYETIEQCFRFWACNVCILDDKFFRNHAIFFIFDCRFSLGERDLRCLCFSQTIIWANNVKGCFFLYFRWWPGAERRAWSKTSTRTIPFYGFLIFKISFKDNISWNSDASFVQLLGFCLSRSNAFFKFL